MRTAAAVETGPGSSSRLAEKLLDFMAETPNQCLPVDKVYQAVWGYSYNTAPYHNEQNLGNQVQGARRILRKNGEERGLWLGFVQAREKLILVENELISPGTNVALPGLYDQVEVPPEIEFLVPLIEAGKLNSRNRIVPLLAPAEEGLLFQMAREPGTLCHYSRLGHSAGAVIKQGSNLTKKLRPLETGIKIETVRDQGLILHLPTPIPSPE